ncbi:transmembrane protein 174 [Phyllobates terribilis]|uniref:transmembrane protein 174 n=1 Tax=Phyllobates terribilis TaxID=111132 RepID=UPI003CCB28D8
MEQNNPPVDDFSLNVFPLPPYPNSQPDVQVAERDKAGATLLFSGLFLGLVGVTFTVMGWIRRDGNQGFEWSQLLGPILLSVGVTFALISVCRFKMLACKFCKRSNETTVEPEQSSAGQSFVFTGINQPITFHGATVVQYIPPPYNTHDVLPRSPDASPPISSNRSAGVVNGIVLPIHPPQYCSIYPLENPAFIEDEESPSSPDHERSPVSSHHHDHSTNVHWQTGSPPLYEDLYPGLK